jgi:hypothetical protein
MTRVRTLARLLMLIGLLAACGSPATVASPAAPTVLAATTTPVASLSPTPSAAATGTITGRLSYPSDFVPPVTVYAISVSDSSIWFSTDTPRFGNPLWATLPPGPTWPSTGPGSYSIRGLAPGTYYVIAYRNDTPDPQVKLSAAAYTQSTAKCGAYNLPTPLPGPCPYDHSLVPVTVTAGQTVSRIDIGDWFVQGGIYPPRPR